MDRLPRGHLGSGFVVCELLCGSSLCGYPAVNVKYECAYFCVNRTESENKVQLYELASSSFVDSV